MISELWYVPKAKKDLYKLDKTIRIHIFKKLDDLKINPELGKPLSNALKNKRSLHVGNYRLIYTPKDNKIYILKVGPRKTIYGEYTYDQDDSQEVYNSAIRSPKSKISYNAKEKLLKSKTNKVIQKEFSNNINDDTEEDKKMMLAVLQDIAKRKNVKWCTLDDFNKRFPHLKKYTIKKKKKTYARKK